MIGRIWIFKRSTEVIPVIFVHTLTPHVYCYAAFTSRFKSKGLAFDFVKYDFSIFVLFAYICSSINVQVPMFLTWSVMHSIRNNSYTKSGHILKILIFGIFAIFLIAWEKNVRL